MSGLLSPTKIQETSDTKESLESFKLIPMLNPNADFDAISEESNSAELNKILI